MVSFPSITLAGSTQRLKGQQTNDGSVVAAGGHHSAHYMPTYIGPDSGETGVTAKTH